MKNRKSAVNPMGSYEIKMSTQKLLPCKLQVALRCNRINLKIVLASYSIKYMLDQTLLQNNQKTRFWKEGMSRPPHLSSLSMSFFLYAAGRNFAGSLAGVYTTYRIY
jgi:hypothetical protein